MLMTGNKDQWVDMESIIKSTDFVEKLSVKVVDGAGHFPHQEHPETVNKLLLSFLVGEFLAISIYAIVNVFVILFFIIFCRSEEPNLISVEARAVQRIGKSRLQFHGVVRNPDVRCGTEDNKFSNPNKIFYLGPRQWLSKPPHFIL